MIKLFGVNDTIFNSNGDKVIMPLRAKVHKEDNGSFYLDFECSLDYINDKTIKKILTNNKKIPYNEIYKENT